MLIIGDIMTGHPVTIAPQATLRDAVELLAAYGISGMPVVDGRAVIGTLSARDIVDFESTMQNVPTQRQNDGLDDAFTMDDYAAGSAEFFVNFWDDAGADAVERIRCSNRPEWDHLADYVVADAMSTALTTFLPSEPADKAADYMQRTGAHRAVVVANGVLMGIVTTMDITRAVAEGHAEERLEEV
jgi:CBS domain-containing protein